MKRIGILPLTLMMVSFAFLQPPSLFAEDKDQKDQKKGDEKKAEVSHHGGKPEVARRVQKGPEHEATARDYKSHGKVDAEHTAGAYHSTNPATQNTALSVHGNRGNHYNGQWVEGNTHSDWDRNGDHYWHDHHYRWYDGGWLIVDVGVSPGYYDTGSIEGNVQEKLSDQGYYNGPIDGDIGPVTSRAIAHYQSDQGLQVNGRIDDPTLSSLGLE